MTLGQFFLGCVAILIATVVYRWQKSVDRSTEVLAERRCAYEAVISTRCELISAIRNEPSDNPEKLILAFKTKCECAMLIAPKNVMEFLLDHSDALLGLAKQWRKESFPLYTSEGEHGELVKAESATYTELLIGMRKETFAHTAVDFRIRNESAF